MYRRIYEPDKEEYDRICKEIHELFDELIETCESDIITEEDTIIIL